MTMRTVMIGTIVYIFVLLLSVSYVVRAQTDEITVDVPVDKPENAPLGI